MTRKLFRSWILIIALAALTAQPPSSPAQETMATTRAADVPPRYQAFIDARLDAFHKAVDALNLGDPEKEKIDSIIDTARKSIIEKAQQMQADDTPIRERVQDTGAALAALRQKISQALDKDQQEAFQARIEDIQRRARPATRPANGGAGTSAPRSFFDRFKTALTQLELSDEQTQKVNQLVEENRQKMAQAMKEANGDRAVIQDTARQAMRDTREQLGEILSAEQMEKLSRLMRSPAPPTDPRNAQGRAPSTSPADAPSRSTPAMEDDKEKMAPQMDSEKPGIQKGADAKSPDAKTSDDKPVREKLKTDNRDGDKFRNDRFKNKRPSDPKLKDDVPNSEKPSDPLAKHDNAAPDKPQDTSPPIETGNGPKLGQAAPDFQIKRLDGRPVQLSFFKGRVLVLVFGSYSTPTFRARAPSLEQLQRQFGSRAEFLLVYTRESHPTGSHQVERNKDDKVELEQPQDLPAREALAKQARTALHLTLPIAIDSMDDSAARAYGVYPNGAVVIDRDGNVAFVQKWFEPYALTLALNQTLAPHPASAPAE